MEDFEINGNYVVCKHCGSHIKRGVFTISEHFVYCLKRKDGLWVAKNDKEKIMLDNCSIIVVSNKIK